MFWFPTQKGVVKIDPHHIRANDLPPPVVIEQVLLNRKSIGPAPMIEVQPGPSDLEIQYTGLSFTVPEKVRFKYKLAGLHEEWVDVGTRRAAYYNHVPPGEYSFTVIAANSDGVWNTEGAVIKIVVIPPFYRTWWFMVLAVIAVALIGVALYEWRIWRLKRAKVTQEEFSRRLIQSQESERKRIAAELHDSLGQSLVIIKNRALFGINAPVDDQHARKQFTEISAQSAQAIAEVKEIAYNLRPYLLDRLGLTKAIESMLNKVANSSGVRFVTEVDSLDGLFSKDDEINIYRIVQESVNNIIKHAQAREAVVIIRRDGPSVSITVRDDGKGFSPEITDGGAQPRRGFGLIGITERARILGAKPEVHSSPGRGTTLELKLLVKDELK
jgi:signal transduction histidine kinase